MREPIPEQPFDYTVLDEQTRDIVVRTTDETHGLMKRTTENIIQIGQNLLLIQKHLPDMAFSSWLRAEFDLSRQSAYNFMRVATKFGGSCKTVLQLPARVLYELASSSDAIIEDVETGELPPTLQAIRTAKAAERASQRDAQEAQSRLEVLQMEVEAKQDAIEQLRQELEDVRQQRDALPRIQVKEVEKPVVPVELKDKIATLEAKLSDLGKERDALSRQVTILQGQVIAEAQAREEGEHVRRIRRSWYRATSEFQRSVRAVLSQWPSPLDVLVFEADDWVRLSQVRDLAQRFLNECVELTTVREGKIVDGSGGGLPETPDVVEEGMSPK